MKIFIVILLIYSTLTATSFYVRDGASGNNDGSDWINAWEDMDDINWNRINRGDIIYIADGTYQGDTFNKSESGSQLIQILKATVISHGTGTGWQSDYGDGRASFLGTITFASDYWIFDGKTGSDTTGHGFYITPNDCSNDNAVIMSFSSASYIHVSHTEMEHCGEDNEYHHDVVYCNSNSQHILISYCFMHNCNRNIVTLSNGSNWTFEYCVFKNNHTNSSIHNQGFQGGPGNINNITIRYNYWINCSGSGVIYIDDNTGFHDIYVYGNVIYTTNPSRYYVSGNRTFGSGTQDAYMANCMFYNNTVVNYIEQGVSHNHGEGNMAFNNIFFGYSRIGFSAVSHDYNAFSGANGQGESHAQTGINHNVFIDNDANNFQLNVPLEPGLHLNYPYNMDMNGNIRGAIGNWTRGAFEYYKTLGLVPQVPTRLQIKTYQE